MSKDFELCLTSFQKIALVTIFKFVVEFGGVTGALPLQAPFCVQVRVEELINL